MSKTLIVIVALALVVVFFMLKQKPQVTRTRQIKKEKGNMRCRPVYIDHPTVYLDAPITYTEWDTKISSSL